MRDHLQSHPPLTLHKKVLYKIRQSYLGFEGHCYGTDLLCGITPWKKPMKINVDLVSINSCGSLTILATPLRFRVRQYGGIGDGAIVSGSKVGADPFNQSPSFLQVS